MLASSRSMTSPTAGWYTDPQIPGHERFWDGNEWAAQTRPAPPAVTRMQAQAHLPRTVVESDRKGKPVQASVAWVIAICTVGYMVPWAIAATRGKSNAGAIGWLNLLVGWTFIGWIVALVMACGSHQKFAVTR
jgi:hypothetical protein